MKRVLITGATGFVGYNLTRHLLEKGYNIHLLVRPGYKQWRIEEILSKIKLYEIDLLDKESLIRLISKIKPQWIFHLAAYGAYSYQTDLSLMINTNLIGTINLVEACVKIGFEAFVNTGSSSEYGFKDHPPSETDFLEPSSHYAITKASATMFCQYTARKLNLHLPTLRLYSVFGPYEEPTRLMPTLLIRGLKGKLPPLVNPDIARDYVYIEDVNEAYILAASKNIHEYGAIYNVGSGIQTTIRDVVNIARNIMNIPEEPQWGSMENRSWDTNCWLADNSKICKNLGWSPQYSFEKGFRLMMKFFSDNPNVRAIYEKKL